MIKSCIWVLVLLANPSQQHGSGILARAFCLWRTWQRNIKPILYNGLLPLNLIWSPGPDPLSHSLHLFMRVKPHDVITFSIWCSSKLSLHYCSKGHRLPGHSPRGRSRTPTIVLPLPETSTSPLHAGFLQRFQEILCSLGEMAPSKALSPWILLQADCVS